MYISVFPLFSFCTWNMSFPPWTGYRSMKPRILEPSRWGPQSGRVLPLALLKAVFWLDRKPRWFAVHGDWIPITLDYSLKTFDRAQQCKNTVPIPARRDWVQLPGSMWLSSSLIENQTASKDRWVWVTSNSKFAQNLSILVHFVFCFL